MTYGPTRRRILAGLSGIGGAALLGRHSPAAEGSLETTTVRLMRTPVICHAPQFVAEELLQAAEIDQFFRPASPQVHDDIGCRVVFFVPVRAMKHECPLLAIHPDEAAST